MLQRSVSDPTSHSLGFLFLLASSLSIRTSACGTMGRHNQSSLETSHSLQYPKLNTKRVFIFMSSRCAEYHDVYTSKMFHLKDPTPSTVTPNSQQPHECLAPKERERIRMSTSGLGWHQHGTCFEVGGTLGANLHTLRPLQWVNPKNPDKRNRNTKSGNFGHLENTWNILIHHAFGIVLNNFLTEPPLTKKQLFRREMSTRELFSSNMFCVSLFFRTSCQVASFPWKRLSSSECQPTDMPPSCWLEIFQCEGSSESSDHENQVAVNPVPTVPDFCTLHAMPIQVFPQTPPRRGWDCRS